MKLRLDGLKFDMGNPFLIENDVHVDFEYERLESHEIKFFMSSYVGNSDDDYRFCLRLIYILDFEDDSDLNDDMHMIQKAIDAVIPSFTDLIIIIDSVVKVDEERH